MFYECVICHGYFMVLCNIVHEVAKVCLSYGCVLLWIFWMCCVMECMK